MRNRQLFLAALLAIGALLSCSGDQTGMAPPNSVVLSIRSIPDSVRVEVATISGTDTLGTPVDLELDRGTVVTLTMQAVHPSLGARFQRWTSGAEILTDSTSVTLNLGASISVTGEYTAVARVHLEATTEHCGFTLVPADLQGGTYVTSPADVAYEESTPVSITVPPTTDGKIFRRWTAAGSPISDDLTLVITATDGASYVAEYEIPELITVVIDTNDSANRQALDRQITCSPADFYGRTSGSLPLVLSFQPGSPVVFTAPATVGINWQYGQTNGPFIRWRQDGVAMGSSRQLVLTIERQTTLTAVYPSYRTTSLEAYQGGFVDRDCCPGGCATPDSRGCGEGHLAIRPCFRIAGDREFAGWDVFDAIIQTLSVDRAAIAIRVTYHVTELDHSGGDGSEWKYEGILETIPMPNGYRLTRILSQVDSRAHGGAGEDHTEITHAFDAPSPVEHIELKSDTEGNDVGRCTSDDDYLEIFWRAPALHYLVEPLD